MKPPTYSRYSRYSSYSRSSIYSLAPTNSTYNVYIYMHIPLTYMYIVCKCVSECVREVVE